MVFSTWGLVLIVAWELTGVVAVLAVLWLLVATLRGSPKTRLPRRIASIAGGLFVLVAAIGAARCSSSETSAPPPLRRSATTRGN